MGEVQLEKETFQWDFICEVLVSFCISLRCLL